jgi:hypothetical protein
MAVIQKIDVIGIKPLRAKGKFGMDMYAAWVTSNIQTQLKHFKKECKSNKL